MVVHQEKQNGVAVVAPVGRFDSTTSEEVERALLGLLDEGERRLVIDLAGVDYISSAGLRVLLVAAKRVAGGRGTLVLCGLTDPVRQVFDLAGFLPLFTLDESRAIALARLSGGA